MLDNIEIQEYPSDFMMRYNCFTSLYCDIAMEAFYDAMQLFNTMKIAKWRANAPSVDFRMPTKLQKKAAVAIVFSAMAAEAFINDYLAVRLTDDVFFLQYNKSNVHYYDKLDIILLHILRQRNHKRFSWYQDVRRLFDLRNRYVHSSSKELSAKELIALTCIDEEVKEREMERLEAISKTQPDNLETQIHMLIGSDACAEELDDSIPKIAGLAKREQLRQNLADSQFALTALCNLTRNVELLDPNSRAFSRTFNAKKVIFGEDDEREIRLKVFPKLGVNPNEVTL